MKNLKKMKVILALLSVAFGTGIAILHGRGGRYDRVILLKDRRGFWDFPYGTRERGETAKVWKFWKILKNFFKCFASITNYWLKQAAIREAKEELGIKENKLTGKLDRLSNSLKTSTNIFIACYRGDLITDMGLRKDHRITTAKAGETYEWQNPKGKVLIN